MGGGPNRRTVENISLGSENSDEVVRQHTFGRLTMGMLYTVRAICMLSRFVQCVCCHSIIQNMLLCNRALMDDYVRTSESKTFRDILYS